MEAVSRPEDGLFTFAETLEWPDLNFSVVCVNHSVVTWTMSWGKVEKHQNLLVPHPPPGACILPLVPLQMPADSISSAGLLPTLRGFGYKSVFININTELMCSVLLFLSPLPCVAILGSGTKVSAAIYSRGRCTMPSAWVGMRLPG